MKMIRRSMWLVALPAALMVASQSCAWGPEGHAIVAEIAEARLTPAAKAQVTALLALEHHQHLDQVSSWPDDYRPMHPETGPWHFVDIPLSASEYEAKRDCDGGNCVVVQIQHFAAGLGDSKASPQDRLTALKFVVHFLGDIHQPLHCEDNGDKGGNDVHLAYFHKGTNLHAVWDGGIIEQALHVKLGPHFMPDLNATATEAANLGHMISGSDSSAWAPADLAAHLDTVTVSWANESHALAQAAYEALPKQRAAGWDETYQGAEWPVVTKQLERGGIRLGELLNEELK